MPTLDFIVQPRLAPSLSLAEDRHLLQVVGRSVRPRHGVLRVYDFPGDILSLGRYHRIHTAAPRTPGVGLFRRHTGGRMVPFGEGFVGVALVLPHRSALVSDEPLALAPHQVMNRYVRGVLEACRAVNIRAFYPGRDIVTVDRRVLALVSFEVDRRGALLCEAVIANRRDFGVLPQLLAAAGGRVAVHEPRPLLERGTCLARELGTELTLAEVAHLIRAGYEREFKATFEEHVLDASDRHAIAGVMAQEFGDERWLCQRRVRTDLDHYACAAVQLGVFEAGFALAQDRVIKEVAFAGDFIANSPAVVELEHELQLCPAEWRAINAVATQVLSRPANYVLGIGAPRTVADTMCKALVA